MFPNNDFELQLNHVADSPHQIGFTPLNSQRTNDNQAILVTNANAQPHSNTNLKLEGPPIDDAKISNHSSHQRRDDISLLPDSQSPQPNGGHQQVLDGKLRQLFSRKAHLEIEASQD